jgi:hypothetical protein
MQAIAGLVEAGALRAHVEAVFGHRLRRPAAGPEEPHRPPSVRGSVGT